MTDTYLSKARADAARALSILDGLLAGRMPGEEKTVVSGPPEMTEVTERYERSVTQPSPSSATEDEALAWASAELRRLSAESPSGRVSGDAIAAVYRRVALWD